MSQQTEYILRLPDVKKRTGLSKTVIYDLINKGQFPKQLKLGQRAVGWKNSAIQAWIDQQVPAR